MATESSLRFAAQSDIMTSLLAVVNLVRTGQATTRPEIGRVTGLGRGVVTQRIDQAIELGYLEDGDFAPSTGGRLPRSLRFRSERGRLVILALGALHLRVGIATLDGTIEDDAHRYWDITQGPVATLEEAMSMAGELLSRVDEDRPIWGVAVGVPGPVDFSTGRPVAPPIMPGWNDFDIRKSVEERFGAPVWVDNDVNLLALSERSRRQVERLDLVFCKVGTGIGAGFLSQSHLHRGVNGAAGDIGHERVADSQAVCRCGKTGCLEAEAAGWALVREAGRAIVEGRPTSLAEVTGDPEGLTPEAISLAARDGDALAIELVQRSARLVGESIAGLVNMFNPAVIVVGGAVSAAGEIFLAEVRQRVYELSLPLATRDLAIVRSVGDAREPLRGGAEMVREQLFEVTFPRWFADGHPTIESIRGLAISGA
ncbi:ROK family protein [Salinactinospora qingdaonensis]|uniref:ROK family transcriptional regulator n=1 Tax=Salinactinospora qingdaonensis TaxID=702744 RepID=A0ABP7G6E6_9ACTN